jgi:Glycosyl hydrolases family 16
MTAGRRLWVDDFDGAPGTRPSARFWSAELGGGGWGDAQLQNYTDDPANAALDGQGRLAIVARRAGDAVTSARLITKGLVAVRYGRIEARIKVPAGRGGWLAFWLLGNDIDTLGWPRCGEIDVMEHVGSQPRTVPWHAALSGTCGCRTRDRDVTRRCGRPRRGLPCLRHRVDRRRRDLESGRCGVQHRRSRAPARGRVGL